MKQTSRVWSKIIDNFPIRLRFTTYTSKHGVYVKDSSDNNKIIMCLYVDDLLFTILNEDKLKIFKANMIHEFEMSNLGNLSYLLEMEFVNTRSGVFLHLKNMHKTF